MITHNPPPELHYFTTREYAHHVGVQSTTVRRRYCMEGHYLGIRPKKLPNGRLLWLEAEVNAIFDACDSIEARSLAHTQQNRKPQTSTER
jgi:hypothetical protein